MKNVILSHHGLTESKYKLSFLHNNKLIIASGAMKTNQGGSLPPGLNPTPEIKTTKWKKVGGWVGGLAWTLHDRAS